MTSDRVFGRIATLGFAVSFACWALTFFGYVPSESVPTIPLYAGVIVIGIPAALRSKASHQGRTKLRFVVPTRLVVAVVVGAAIVFGIGLAGMAANPTPAAVDRLDFTLLSAMYGVAAALLLLLEEYD